MRTDPKNTAYVVTEGGKRRDHGEDKVREGEEGLVILSAEEREKRREDAFAVLEGRVEEKTVQKENGRRIEELKEARSRDWEDPYQASRRLRKGFRRERKVRAREHEASEGIREKMGLAIELLPEDAEDRQRAKTVEFGSLPDGDERASLGALSKPMFGSDSPKQTALSEPKKRKKILDPETVRRTLQQQLQGNTRAALNPFDTGSGKHDVSAGRFIAAAKPKVAHSATEVRDQRNGLDATEDKLAALVQYDSD